MTIGSDQADSSSPVESKHETFEQDQIHTLIFDNVCHDAQESYFTHFSKNLKLDGFKNFVFLILIIACGRLILENLSTYGLAANPLLSLRYAIEYGLSGVSAFYLSCLVLFVLISFVLEKSYLSYLYANQRVTQLPNGTIQFKVTDREERIFTQFYLTNLFAFLCVPMFANYLYPANPYMMPFICIIYLANILKLYSYHQVNSWWRSGNMYGKSVSSQLSDSKKTANAEKYAALLLNQTNNSKPDLIFYPNNLTLPNIAYFIIAPTLCYQLNFPRTKCRNYRLIMRCLIEIILLVELQSFLLEQWVLIPLESRLIALNELSVSELILKWTKLSLGTINIWLLSFYLLFQSMLNLIAEILKFADRDFYRDWWNAKTLGEFWRNWNIPVHRWCVRHLYKPLIIQCGFSSTAASFAIFLFSGLLHEYFASIPLRMFCVHFLVGMTVQQPLDMATENLHKRSMRLANSLIWLSLILGQSALVLLYYNDLVLRMRKDTLLN